MPSTSTTSAIFRQLQATLQLVTILLPHLTVDEIMEIHQLLAYTYGSMEVVLDERLRVEGGTAASKFGTNLLGPLLTFF